MTKKPIAVKRIANILPRWEQVTDFETDPNSYTIDFVLFNKFTYLIRKAM